MLYIVSETDSHEHAGGCRQNSSFQHHAVRSDTRVARHPHGTRYVRMPVFTDRVVLYAWFPLFRCRSSVAVSPFCRCKIPLFCKNYVRKIPFRYSRKQQKETQQQRQRQRCTESATANGNGETATEERQRNGGNRALQTVRSFV